MTNDWMRVFMGAVSAITALVQNGNGEHVAAAVLWVAAALWWRE